MLLAYTHCFGAESNEHSLCLFPDKIDSMSQMVRVATLQETNAAVYRLGPVDCFTVEIDPADHGMMIIPFFPSKLFLTPDLPSYPGMNVKRVKVFQDRSGYWRIFYLSETSATADDWKEWVPSREKRSASAQV